MEACSTLESRTETEILTALLQNAMENGLLNIDDTYINEVISGKHTDNQYVLDLSTHAYLLHQLEARVVEVNNNYQLTTAVGSYLDNLGSIVGVPRILGIPAMVDVTMTINAPREESFTIPAGTSLILDEIYADISYITSEETEFPAGAESINVQCESILEAYQPSLPRNVVRGVSGFPDLSCTNEEGTHGRNIESDDEYRQRIPDGLKIRNVGSYDCLKSYLDSYPGLDSYLLVPHYDGLGTLKIVCETTSSRLGQISDDVYKNCMLVTDVPPLCVEPGATLLQSIVVSVKVEQSTYTNTELEQIIRQSVFTFIDGGVRRDGSAWKGLGIGEDFQPGQLISYLMAEVPEVLNVQLGSYDSVVVPAENRVSVGSVEVNFL